MRFLQHTTPAAGISPRPAESSARPPPAPSCSDCRRTGLRTRSELPRASRPASSRIFRVRPRMSVSVTRPATACLRHCLPQRVMALLLARGDRPVRNQRDARVSIHHCAACALLSGAAGVPEFAEPIVFRPDIVSLRQKVRAELDTSLPDGAARVAIHLASGETLSETVMAATVSLADPLSDFDIEAKLCDCSRLGGTAWNADTVIDDVWRLDALVDVSSLMNAHDGPAPAMEEAVSGSVRAARGN